MVVGRGRVEWRGVWGGRRVGVEGRERTREFARERVLGVGVVGRESLGPALVVLRKEAVERILESSRRVVVPAATSLISTWPSDMTRRWDP